MRDKTSPVLIEGAQGLAEARSTAAGPGRRLASPWGLFGKAPLPGLLATQLGPVMRAGVQKPFPC